ncbi:MAG: hypothetical protein SFT93_00110 [Rickettsiaceae bacterium]|nr:hypothetical protein [Rickettsiaceae bacterium]
MKVREDSAILARAVQMPLGVEFLGEVYSPFAKEVIVVYGAKGPECTYCKRGSSYTCAKTAAILKHKRISKEIC